LATVPAQVDLYSRVSKQREREWDMGRKEPIRTCLKSSDKANVCWAGCGYVLRWHLALWLFGCWIEPGGEIVPKLPPGLLATAAVSRAGKGYGVGKLGSQK
jgi:hypothetical protein